MLARAGVSSGQAGWRLDPKAGQARGSIQHLHPTCRSCVCKYWNLKNHEKSINLVELKTLTFENEPKQPFLASPTNGCLASFVEQVF
jgi:hypothetical protein